MRADARLRSVLVAACAALQLGCAASIAPRGWLPDAQQAQQEAYGGWLDLTVVSGADSARVLGEFLAASSDSAYTLRGTTVTASALAAVQRGTLETYDPGEGDVAGIAMMGTVLTLTHGVALVFTAPLWVIVGTTSSATLSRDGKYRVDGAARRGQAPATGAYDSNLKSWRDLRLYARFPQGMPAGLDRTRLHERQPGKRTRVGQPDHGSITMP